MFTGLGFAPFFYLLFFGSFEGNFIFYKNVLFVMLSDFMDYIKYLLLVLLSSAVGIGYIVRNKLITVSLRKLIFNSQKSQILSNK